MDEQRVQAYLSLIQELLDCPSGEEPQILSQSLELLDGGFVQVCEQVAAQLQEEGQENNAQFLRNVAQQVGAYLAQQGTGGNQQAALGQFWQQMLQAQIQGDTAAVHQVMRQNMGLIVPNLGDVIAQSMPGLLAQNPDQAEAVVGVVENTCISISDFPYGRYGEALEIAIRGYGVVLELRADNPPKRAQTLTNLGVARRSQAEMGINPAANLDSAIAAYDEAAGILRGLGLARDLATTLNNFGFAYKAQSRLAGNSSTQKQQALENAYRSFQAALERVEYLRGEIGADSEGYKRNFNEEWNRVYRGMVEVCLELGRYTDAIEYVDRSKARNLVELIATRDVYPGGVIPENIRQQLQSLKIAIAQAERRLQDEENPDYSHLNQLRQDKQKLEPYKPLHFQAMQGLLDEETAILEWYILPGQKFLTFTLTAERLNLWTSSKEDLDKLIDWGNSYLRDYRNRDNSQWRNTLAESLEALAPILHLDEILANLRQNFPNCQKLILIPHRYLHLFPLHALPVTTEEGESKFLQDLFPKGVAYAPNCQLLQQAQSRSRLDFNRLFVIQNPREDLNYTDLAVETIRTLFPDRDTLARTNATTAKLLDEQRQKILSQTHHLFFSCHAAFNPTSPLDSGLLLADGILTLENIIANLNLSHCSLVTLSACETGQVAVDRTDEYISLSSGFILAGSPSVLVSLWSVNQVSTALLLIRTYELLQQQPGQLALSLQAAQKWLRETTVSGFEHWRQECSLFSSDWREALKPVFAKMGRNTEQGINHCPYQSPYHWAAFTVVGEGEQNYGK